MTKPSSPLILTEQGVSLMLIIDDLMCIPNGQAQN